MIIGIQYLPLLNLNLVTIQLLSKFSFGNRNIYLATIFLPVSLFLVPSNCHVFRLCYARLGLDIIWDIITCILCGVPSDKLYYINTL